MIRLQDGRWLAVNNLYPKPNAVFQIEISDDGAKTWTPVTTVADPGRNLDNGDLIQLPNKDLLLTGRSVVDHQSPGALMTYHLPVFRSTDMGKTWSLLSQVDVSEPPPYVAGRPSLGLWEPYLFLLADGRVACAYANEKKAQDIPAYSQVVSEKVSSDNGATWGPEVVVAAQIGGGAQRPGMPVVTRMKNGQYAAVYEVIGIGNGDVYFKTSRDGVEWAPGIGSRVPNQHAGPWITSLTDGRLLVTSCQNVVSYSNDFGATWLLDSPPAIPIGFVWTWPAIYQMSATQIALMTTKGGVNLHWGKLAPRAFWGNSLSADFRRGEAGWTRYGGKTDVVDGNYVLSNSGTTGKSLTGSETWKDGVLTADVMLTSAGNAGLVFRATNADISGPDAFYGYYVGLDSTGSVFLSRSANDYTQIDRVPRDCPLNTWIPVKIEVQGPKILVYVGDMKTPIIAASDSYCERGQIGVRAHLCNAEFRNIRYAGRPDSPRKGRSNGRKGIAVLHAPVRAD